MMAMSHCSNPKDAFSHAIDAFSQCSDAMINDTNAMNTGIDAMDHGIDPMTLCARHVRNPPPRQLDLPLQKLAEADPRLLQLLRDERAGGEARQRVQLEEVDLRVADGDEVRARVPLAAEGGVGGGGGALGGVAQRVGDARGTDLARAVAEVLAGVVEREAGIGLDFDDRQREGTVALVDDADGELAAGEVLLDDV